MALCRVAAGTMAACCLLMHAATTGACTLMSNKRTRTMQTPLQCPPPPYPPKSNQAKQRWCPQLAHASSRIARTYLVRGRHARDPHLPAHRCMAAARRPTAHVRRVCPSCPTCPAAGDELHLLHVIPPGQYVVLSTDLGMEEVVEDDAETQKRVVGGLGGGAGAGAVGEEEGLHVARGGPGGSRSFWEAEGVWEHGAKRKE